MRLSPHLISDKNSNSEWQEALITNNLEAKETTLMNPWRTVPLVIVLLLIFGIFIARLFHLQVVEGGRNRELADSNRIQIRTIHAPRGVIYDRNGKILAQNEPGFRLVESSSSGKRVSYLAREEALKMEAERDPRFKNLEIDTLRSYPLREKTAHILGYVGEIDEEELKDTKFKGYRLGDKIGRGGVEEVYEKVLRGIAGGEIIEVDASGNKVRTLRKTEAIAGHSLYLTVDADLQAVAFDRLMETTEKVGSCCGAVVVSDPFSGQVLSLVSLPSFDPNNLAASLLAKNSPLLNRAIAGLYPPGSTFKVVSALAGLESGKIQPTTQFEDTGVMFLGPYKFSNWYFNQYGKTEGLVDVIQALKRSNDTFFYKMSQLTGDQAIGDMSKLLGLGTKLGIDIPGELTGVVPNNEWKIRNIGQPWYPGDTLHMSIGQGFLLATPLQVNNLISAVASEGRQYPPHLALKIANPGGATIKEFVYDSVAAKLIDKGHLEAVRKGLVEVPKAGGTAWPFFTFPVPTAGKTGTAEFGDPKDRTHAWYTSYGPTADPKITVTVLVEGGGEGSSVASPVAKEIYRWYFSPDKNNLLKDVYPATTDSSKIISD